MVQFLSLLLGALLVSAPASSTPPASTGTQSGAGPLIPGLRESIATPDGAVPLDWAGPAARMPGPDDTVAGFDPAASLFGPADLCVVTPGQPAPPCAAKPAQITAVSDDIFTGSNNPDATCQTQEDVRIGADGKPQRVFATVCGDEVESWDFRQRTTPSSKANPRKPTDRAIGPNDLVPQKP